VFRKPTIEQLSEFIEPTFRALCDGSRYVDERLREIFDELQPDVIAEDNVVAFPAIDYSGKPWVRLLSCNPLELKDPAIAPVFSGYAQDDSTGWDAFRAEYLRAHAGLHPAEIDYRRSAPLSPRWHRIDSSVRRHKGELELPDEIASGKGRLVYLSLGSLGSADVELMRRLVDVLSRSPHRFIVSKGPQADEYTLAENMWGAEFLPQPALMPHVDLVITHGGNNTTTECFHFGKPMVVLPLFWDQYDNAQRVHETGFGIRLRTYAFEDHQLLDAVERLLGDTDLHARMRAISTRIQASPGHVHAADLIERLLTTGNA
jgi:UDP:flavonoid glycosyltransferase YjiC (YdhE family)